MKKIISVSLAVILCLLCVAACADTWVVPINNFPGIKVKMADKLYSRSGPSTDYTEHGAYDITGLIVTVLSLKYDMNAVPWVEVDYNGRRLWTGAKRIDISSKQLAALPVEDGSFLGYGQILSNTTPRFGPGINYALHDQKMALKKGSNIVVIKEENNYFLIECEYYDTQRRIFRCWVPVDQVSVLIDNP